MNPHFTTKIVAKAGYDHRDDPDDRKGASGAVVLVHPGRAAGSGHLGTDDVHHGQPHRRHRLVDLLRTPAQEVRQAGLGPHRHRVEARP